MKKILGVYFRGTNQKAQERHSYPSTIPQMEKKIYSLLDSNYQILKNLIKQQKYQKNAANYILTNMKFIIIWEGYVIQK